MARGFALSVLLALAAVMLVALSTSSVVQPFVGITNPSAKNIRGAIAEDSSRSPGVTMHLFDVFDPTWTPDKIKAQKELDDKRAKDEQERVTFSAAAVAAILLIAKTQGAF
eukprot:TRINITY_DN9100_c0_g1_i1.p1 TRINITY_DN9100_c0_g1~~TRINITY_DN9100_c0_g1_i1.p1  ORF type:complete len:111 (+),score=20.66 TRINITY_DN9100_c0_g1_i1:155-487(+)